MKTKTINNLLFLVLFSVLLSSCRSSHKPVKELIHKPETIIVYPAEVNIEVPVADITQALPEVSLDQVETSTAPYSLDITDEFSSRDIEHIASIDPKLFQDKSSLIVDLSTIGKENYCFPLPNAKVISQYMGRRKGHTGVDLKTFANDTIVAVFDGIVRMAKPYAAYGNVIVVRHFNGLETIYSHNSKHLIKQGERVKAGQPIALTGRTGRATTEHLHFEVRINGRHFNPALLFDFEKQELQNKCLLCTKKGDNIVVKSVDSFPYQVYISK